ncbi:hypothetical protein [Flavobacterium noncentrifugens]|uniref:Lipoprotein n=1 Tax=Flavobacterium noncentrifugens TaxID=1128970 RepID=A0A1G8Y912_9FLAO|nr:hypothetical protein [Flavobacterium noncentrifugens]SDJ98530.1 hypothetical protein SAMN04487935_2213 [Flavobacterium noncentrifugens]
MKKVIILSVLFVFSCCLFSCTGDDLPAATAVHAADPLGGQGGVIPTPPTPPKP